MSCVPGMTCWENPVTPCDSCNGATTFFFQNGCAPNFTLCSTNVLYCGTNLTVSGINNGDNLTIAFKKIDDILLNAGITLTTIGNSGPATLISGVLNIPNYIGGITNSAALNELMKSDGTNAVPSGMFSTSLGSIILGSTSISGDRTISTFSSSSNSDLIIDTKLSGVVSELFRFTTNPNNSNSAIKIPLGGLSIMGNTAVTNTVASGLNVDMTTSGTPTNGFGTGINFSINTLSGKKNIGFVQSLIEDITNGAEKSAIRFSTMTGGTSPTEVFRFSSFGGIGIGGANFGTLGQVLTSGGPSGPVTWTTVSGGGGITNSALNNEMMKSDGTNAISSGIFSTILGNINLGTSSLTGNRTISAPSSSSSNTLIFQTTNSSSIATNLMAMSLTATESQLISFSSNGFLIPSKTRYTTSLLVGNGATAVRQFESIAVTSGGPSTFYPMRIGQANSLIVTGQGAGIEFVENNNTTTLFVTSTIESVTTAITAGSESAYLLFKTVNTGTLAERLRISETGNIYGTSGTQAMTDGFFYIPSAAGAPSGIPTFISGRLPMYYDSTNNQFYVYNTAWKKVTLT